MGIIKTKPLTELLSQSISYNVTYALLMTDSGALLAAGTTRNPSDAKRARTHAALAASIWCSYDHLAAQGSIDQALPDVPSTDNPAPPPPGLKFLTVELSDHNMHIQVVTAHILLCLIGPKYPSSQSSSNSSLHSSSCDPLHSQPGSGSPPESVPKSSGSGGSAGHTGGTRTPAAESMRPPTGLGGFGGAGGGSLGILKTQAQGLVSYLEKELQGFEVRE